MDIKVVKEGNMFYSTKLGICSPQGHLPAGKRHSKLVKWKGGQHGEGLTRHRENHGRWIRMVCDLTHAQENSSQSSTGKECQRIRMFSRVNGVLFSCFSTSVPALVRLRKMKTFSLTSYFHLRRIRGRAV